MQLIAVALKGFKDCFFFLLLNDLRLVTCVHQYLINDYVSVRAFKLQNPCKGAY